MSRVFIDRGGTFTDVVVLKDGLLSARKVPSDQAVVGEIAADLGAQELTFGTTVATNALLERDVVPSLLIVTAGFEDLPWIGDMRRPALFEPDEYPRPPLVTRVFGVGGRIGADGQQVAPVTIDEEMLSGALEGIEAVAVALLHANVNPAHELRLAERVKALAPTCALTLGHRCVPERGYIARIETAMVDAAVTPILRRALVRDRLLLAESDSQESAVTGLATSNALLTEKTRAIRSDGSLVPVTALRAPEAVLSGPAGGVLAVAEIARACGFRRAVGLDMGGTSTDVCRVDVELWTGEPGGEAEGEGGNMGLPWREGLVEVAGVRVRRRMLEVETIAAGGGSVLTNDGLQMRVGPESAGANPGPQCYGRGGPPTLTDAVLAMGLMRPASFEPPLDRSKVELPGAAEEFIGIAREAMAQAVRGIATARGVSLHDHALVVYGGAAGQHAAGVAERLGIDTVIIHPLAAVMSALGQSLARREEERICGVWAPVDLATVRTVLARVEHLQTEVLEALPGATLVRTAEVRYRSTDHTIDVVFDVGEPEALLAALQRSFAEIHRARFGFDRELGLEVVHLRVRGFEPRPRLAAVSPSEGEGVDVAGPTVLHERFTSVDVPAGWVARTDTITGGIRLVRAAVSPGRTRANADTERTPFGAQLWASRFQSVANDAGRVLERLAQSVNIRERLDFSVAVFDGDGALVANAPHIPVHLGAMGATVRDLIASVPDLIAGQAYLTNDPAAGGSHLPDLTVVTPVSAGLDGRTRFFVACRGHHADVGGLTPGSMPPHSTRLVDEGFVVRHVPLLAAGRVVAPEHVLQVSRQPDLLVADLGAQVAANAHAAKGLLQLGPPRVLEAWMAHLSDVAAEAVAAYIQAVTVDLCGLASFHAVDELDGIPLILDVRARASKASSDARLVFDFTGCGGPHSGNLNCPSAVVRASVLYALRVLVAQDIPMNDGALRHVEILLPESSILSPPSEAAIVGGNVETSQRIVDLIFLAMGGRAASQGTMNNLTIGGTGWSVYETLGGGAGASAVGPGLSGRQVHMTNTRATDPEAFEARLPLRLEHFGIRAGSGGGGRHRGGDGLIREVTLLEDGIAALLAPRQEHGRVGIEGGQPGLGGRDELWQSGRWQAWDGRAVQLKAGDRVRVSTPGGGGWGDAEES